MVEISEVNLIECPDCERKVLDNVKYCRFCGHTFNDVNEESSGKFSRFLKHQFKGKVDKNLRYCTECKHKINDFDMEFCENCGILLPFQNEKYFCSCGNIEGHPSSCIVCHRNSKKEITHEEFNQILNNQFFIPLSKKYNQNLSKTNFKEYFNLTNEEASHIIYIIVYNILFEKLDGDIVEFFKKVLEETKQNYADIEKALSNKIKKKLSEEFNNDGIVSSSTSTIKQSFTETIETPHIKNKHGTGTKVLATAVAGPLGFVATSGVKQETKSRQVRHSGKYSHQKVTLTKNQIVYETYEDDESYGFKYSMNHSVSKFIVNWEDVKTIDDENYLILNSGDTIHCSSSGLTTLVRKCILEVMGSCKVMSNMGFFDDYTNLGKKNAKKLLNELIKNHIDSITYSKPKVNSSSDIDSLERIMNMYEKGLLTNEEFSVMKQNIIGSVTSVKTGEDNVANADNDNTSKFCGNCGAEIIPDSKFCTQCGNPLN